MKKRFYFNLTLFLILLTPTQFLFAQDQFVCQLDFDVAVVGVCNDSKGSIQLHIKDGFGPYKVSWSSNNNAISEVLTTAETAILLDDLPTGPFSIKVVDEFSKCSVIKHVLVEFDFLQAKVQATGTPATCSGKGYIEVNIEGTMPPYKLYLTGPKSSVGQINSNHFKIYDLPSGDYEILIEKDGCQNIQKANVGVAEDLPNFEIIAQKDDCGIHTGLIDVNVLAGQAMYQLSWSGPSNGSLAIDGNVQLTGLKTGKYEFVLEDAATCRAYRYIDMNTTPLSLTAEAFPAINERSGFAKVEITGGIPTYEISWTGPVSGNKSTAFSKESIQLPLGEYTMTATDASGCSVSETVDIQTASRARNGNQSLLSNELQQKPILYQNYPNPFNTSTQIKFELPQKMLVNIRIQDQLGRFVFNANQVFEKGTNTYLFNKGNLAKGLYFYTISTEHFKDSKRMFIY